MRAITLVAVAAVLLIDVLGVIPKSSVGGPLTLMLIFFLAILAVGIHEAWTHGRGVLGWIASLLAALVGGFAAAALGGMLLEKVLPLLKLDGPLASSQHPMRYLSTAGMMLVTLMGAWASLWILNRFR